MCRQSGKASPIDYAGLAWCACRRTEARPLSAGRSRRAFLKSEGGSALRSWARSLCPGQMRKKTRRSRTFSQDPERNRIRKRHNTAPVRRKPFVLCGVDTERKGRVSRPLTCSRIFFSSLRGSGAVWDMGAGLLGEASTAGPRGLFAEREPAGVREQAVGRCVTRACRGRDSGRAPCRAAGADPAAWESSSNNACGLCCSRSQHTPAGDGPRVLAGSAI